MKVLHITESYGGGVASAISSYCRNTPDFEHHLMKCNARGNEAAVPEGLFSSVERLTANPLLASGAILQVARQLKPDIVHLHSSFAGVYGRSISHHLHKLGCKIVYTPHCYAFEREDIPKLMRLAFKAVEKYYSWKMSSTDVIAACASREAELAQALAGSRSNAPQVEYIPNIASPAEVLTINDAPSPDFARAKKFLKSGMLISAGRPTVQKNPALFTEIVDEMADGIADENTELSSSENIISALWLGGEVGGNFVGWLKPEELQELLKLAAKKRCIYLHTSLWEGFPVSLLDAARAGLAVVALKRGYLLSEFAILKASPANSETPETTPKVSEYLFKDLSEAKEIITRLRWGDIEYEKCAQAFSELNNTHTPELQAKALRKVYTV